MSSDTADRRKFNCQIETAVLDSFYNINSQQQQNLALLIQLLWFRFSIPLRIDELNIYSLCFLLILINVVAFQTFLSTNRAKKAQRKPFIKGNIYSLKGDTLNVE